MYKHLSREERYQIYSLVKSQHTLTEIARLKGRNRSTISRELDRGRPGYSAEQACRKSAERAQHSRNAHHFVHLDAAGFAEGSKVLQAAAVDDRLGVQVGLGPQFNRIRREAADDVELDVVSGGWLASGFYRDGWDEGNPVYWASTDLASSALATQVSVFQLHVATKRSSGLMPGHSIVDLVMLQRGGRLAYAQVALECQDRDAGQGLADEIDSLNPDRQGQLGAFHQGTGGHQRSLVAGHQDSRPSAYLRLRAQWLIR